MTTSEELDDKFSAHFHRDPLPGDAGIRIVLLTKLPHAEADAVIAPLCEKIAELGRPVEQRVVAVDELGLAEASPAVSKMPACLWCWSQPRSNPSPQSTWIHC